MRRFLVIALVVSVVGGLSFVASAAPSNPATISVCSDGNWKELGFGRAADCQAALRAEALWSLDADFRFAPFEANPSPDAYGNADVWSYLSGPTLSSDDPSTYALLPVWGGTWEPSNPHEREGWLWPGCPSQVWMGYPRIVQIPRPGWTHTSHILVHPAVSCEMQDIIVGWISPMTGRVRIVLELWDANPNVGMPGADGVAWELRRTGSSIPSDLIAGEVIADGGLPGPREYFVEVSEGDSIYLIVSALASMGWDGTGVVFALEGEH